MGRLAALIGVVLLLSGCTKEIRFAMLGAPISYGICLYCLYEICRVWRSPERTILMRPLVLAGPALVLLFSSLLYVGTMSMPLRADGVHAAFWLIVCLAFWLSLPLFMITGVLWRIWVVVSPRTSFEGSALVGAALFFTPGVLLSHKLITDSRTADHLTELMLVFSFYYGAIGGMIALAVLRVESWFRGSR